MHRYIILADGRFAGYAKKELRSFFGNRCGAIDSIDGMLLAEIDIQPDALATEIEGSRFIFVYNAVPMAGNCGVKPGDYDGLVGLLEKSLDKGKRFRMEVLNMKARSGTNAKSIEVQLGTALERKGFVADLSSPEVNAYVIITGGQAFLGIDKRGERQAMDWFRLSVNRGGKSISRAEFKLEEAAEFFGIDFDSVRRCIDVGAAPGGWSAALAKRGASVLAVDQSQLDYDAIKRAGVDVNVTESLDRKDWKGILHLKKSVEKSMEELNNCGIVFGLMMIDMNVEPRKAADAAVKLAPLLTKGGSLLMTVKLPDTMVHKHISAAIDGLKGSYGGIAVRKLPHNRQEVTLYAKKK
jgi:23S rRNA (cytidine2498-2'-O)-methyltransferase